MLGQPVTETWKTLPQSGGAPGPRGLTDPAVAHGNATAWSWAARSLCGRTRHPATSDAFSPRPWGAVGLSRCGPWLCFLSPSLQRDAPIIGGRFYGAMRGR